MRASSLFSILLSLSCAAGVLASHDAAAAAPHQALVRRQRSSSSGSSGGSSSSSGGSSSGKAAEPSSPGPNDVFRAGDQCTTQWSAASGNKWKKMTISLMTGTNQHMTKLEDIATDIDGTTQTSFSWTCPEVEPYSAIYFYQFTDSDGNNPTWCTRFTIASADGSTVPPPNAQQPEGDAIPWGEGKLVNGASSPSSSGSTSGSGQSSTNPSTSGSSGSSNNSSNSSSSAAPSSSSTSSRVASNAAGSNSNSDSNSSTSSNSSNSSNSSTSGGSSGASSLQPVATSAVALMSVMIGAAILL